MKKIAKQTLWMSSAVALALVGCQSAQKKQATPIASQDEDVQFEQQVLESFNRDETTSDWLALFEDRFKSGEWKLSEERKSIRRAIASVAPLIIDAVKLFEKNKSLHDAAVKDALEEANRLGRTRFGARWEAKKSLEELEAYARNDQSFDIELARQFDTINKNKGRYKALKNTSAVTAYQKRIADARAALKASAEQSSSAVKVGAKSVSAQAQAEAIAQAKHLEEVAARKAAGQDALTPFVKGKIDEYLDLRIGQIKAMQGIPPSEVSNMMQDMEDIRTLMYNYVRKSNGGVPPLRKKGCQIVRGEIDSKNMKEMYQTAYDDLNLWVAENSAWIKANPNKPVCPEVAYRGFQKFQNLRGRKGGVDDHAIVELCQGCGACQVDVGKVAQARIIANQTARVTKVKCQ